MGEIVWSTVIEHWAGELGLRPETLGFLVLLALSSLGAFLWALSRRCSRCGSWFTMHEAGVAGSSYRGDGVHDVQVVMRCSLCSAERIARRRMRRRIGF